MEEALGVLAAVASSALGGASIGATRYLAKAIDPFAIGALRFGAGAILLLPIAALMREPWPRRQDWVGVAGLGTLFFFLFPVLLNASLIYTTAARGGLALSTLPLLTMVVAAALGREPLTARKTLGVLVAMIGVALALLSGLSVAPSAAWRGDLLMVAAASCMAFYSVWSKSFVRRASPLTFTAMAMAVGALCLMLLAWRRGSFAPLADFAAPQWRAVVYLGAFGGALTFFLWSYALKRTTPTRVAIAVTVNPVAASLVGATLLGEPLGWNLLFGIATVFVGISIAATEGARQRASALAVELQSKGR